MKEDLIIKRTGLHRILYSFVHSFNGLKWLCQNEAAFKQEILLFVPLTIVAFWLELPAIQTLFVILSMVFVLIAEMINTAIEVMIDRVGLEYHLLSGVAKNIGSALVLVSFLCSLSVWGTVLWLH
ncbi:diacylglycerol kinase [Vibrio zhugei]|uniref:Diacylglycerol kinase n=1 Tax=Vibrio zhugei TaxID=2479546 RepID=A0ABV7CCU6_9VIBR|nr:diacylglycerol kinase [Vibrio zhugei]